MPIHGDREDITIEKYPDTHFFVNISFHNQIIPKENPKIKMVFVKI